jgi:hypothetical protein
MLILRSNALETALRGEVLHRRDDSSARFFNKQNGREMNPARWH